MNSVEALALLADSPERRIASENLILAGLVGSSVHGIGLPDADDRDEMGVCVEPPEYLIGTESVPGQTGFEHYVYRTAPEGQRSRPGDLDLTVYSLRKWARLALKGNPTVSLLLWVPERALTHVSPLGRELRDLAPSFVSKRAGYAHLGYLRDQRACLVGEKPTRTNRPELASKHGYDTKYAAHALRLGYQGVELLETARLTLPLAPAQRDLILEVRRGGVPLPDVLEELDRATAELDRLLATSRVPGDPDRAAVNRWLVDAYQRHWDAAGREEPA